MFDQESADPRRRARNRRKKGTKELRRKTFHRIIGRVASEAEYQAWCRLGWGKVFDNVVE